MASMRSTSRGTYLSNGLRIVGGGTSWLTEQLDAGPGAAPPAAKQLAPGASAASLFALLCTVESRSGERSAADWILDALAEDIRGAWPDCPRLVRDVEVEHAPSRFGGLSYRVASAPGRSWTAELLYRAVHRSMAGVPITTHVTLEERPGFTRLGVRVTADDGIEQVRGYIGAGQAQPAFLQALKARVVPTWMGTPLAPTPIGPGGVPDFVRSVLEAATRTHPAVVLTPREDGSYILDPDALAWELLGRARLYVIQHPNLTFDLTDTIGSRAMSCFWGAARCYFPGWSRHDDPYDHPLLLGARIDDPLLRTAWVGEVGAWFAKRQEVPPVLPPVVPPVAPPVVAPPAAPPVAPSVAPSAAVAPPASSPASSPASPDASRPTPPAGEAESHLLPARPSGDAGNAGPQTASPAAGDAPGAAAAPAHAAGTAPAPDMVQAGASREAAPAVPPVDPSPALAEMATQMSALTGLVRELLAGYGQLAGEVERLGTLSAVRSSSTNAIERRLGRLEDLLEDYFAPQTGGYADTPAGERHRDAGADERAHAEDADDGRLTLAHVVSEVAEVHEDALVMLDSAVKAAGDSPYEDPERVRDVLYAMAQVARKRRDGALGTSLKEAFGALGIDYRAAIAQSTPARLRQQYAFVTSDGVSFEGEEHIVLGNTYNPRRCLRIYFSSRVPGEARFVIGHVGRHFEVMSST